MATNPQAPGQTKISFQVSAEEKAILELLASRSKMKLSAYIRMILSDAIEQGVTFTLGRLTKPTAPESYPMAAEAPGEYGATDSSVQALATGLGKTRKKSSPTAAQKQ